MKVSTLCVSLLVSLAAVVSPGHAAPIFVNGLALSGDLQDKADESKFRVGYFSDIYYDPNRDELWGLSDRGPGGGVLSYGTRVQRFTVDIHPVTGAISKFKIVETVEFTNKLGVPMDGIAPGSALDASNLGNSFDPEGLVVHPVTGNLLVSDEYGPSLYEFGRDGTLIRAFKIPENLKPTNADGSYNFDGDGGATGIGRRTNRGFEGLAISPDGAFVYAMLQSAMVNEGGGSGFCNRIVKFETATGAAVAQFAYQMDTASDGRGISALVAVNGNEFLVLERNNRGIGVGATALTADKKVFRINLMGATNVSGQILTNASCPTVAVAKVSTPFLDLGADTLPELGNRVPEKWEGLAIGPRLRNGSYVVLAGTDNDYSVTQNVSGTQFDVYFDFAAALADPLYDAYAKSIQCPIGKKHDCVFTAGGPAKLTRDHRLLPGVLHSYRVPAADLGPYEPPVQP